MSFLFKALDQMFPARENRTKFASEEREWAIHRLAEIEKDYEELMTLADVTPIMRGSPSVVTHTYYARLEDGLQYFFRDGVGNVHLIPRAAMLSADNIYAFVDEHMANFESRSHTPKRNLPDWF